MVMYWVPAALLFFQVSTVLGDTTPVPFADCANILADKDYYLTCEKQDTNLLCGSDGDIYDNQCYLHLENCYNDYNRAKYPNSSPRISVITSDQEKTCPGWAKKNCAALKCDDMARDSLCASDGNNYPNECVLNRVRCAEKAYGRAVPEVVHKGRCGQRNTPPAPPFVTTASPCPKMSTCFNGPYQPVCVLHTKSGKVGVLRNRCMLSVYQCQGSTLMETACDSTTAPPTRPTYQTLGLVTQPRVATTCQDITCPTIYLPVCGTDDKTYGNLCALSIESCKTKDATSFKSKGPCPK